MITVHFALIYYLVQEFDLLLIVLLLVLSLNTSLDTVCARNMQTNLISYYFESNIIFRSADKPLEPGW